MEQYFLPCCVRYFKLATVVYLRTKRIMSAGERETMLGSFYRMEGLVSRYRRPGANLKFWVLASNPNLEVQTLKFGHKK